MDQIALAGNASAHPIESPSAHQTDRPQAPGPAGGSPESLLAGLNEQQRAAVLHGEGPLLILAGAGSGKTRVLTHRIAYLIQSRRAYPDEILAITFTNKAAKEMRERAEALLGGQTRGIWLSTFHSACARILRANAEGIGFTAQFTIYDQSDSRRLVKRALEGLGVDPKRHSPTAIHNRISQAKNMLIDAERFQAAAGGGFEQLLADVYLAYERQLRSANALDFDDLLLETVRLLQRDADVRGRYANRFRHVLVDEYQDTNHAQYVLLRLLVAADLPPNTDPQSGRWAPTIGAGNLVVVGDDAQSVYGFRGADVRNILDFQRDFPDAAVVKLEQNYRSCQNILDAANALIANNRSALPKRLWSELGTGEPLSVQELDDEHAEARHVVAEIEALLERGAAGSEIAVLYRTNAMSRVLEDALVRNRIGYQVIGAARFYERAEIKDALAYLSLLANPRDAVAFARIVNSPRRGIGQTSLARLSAQAAALDQPIWDLACEPESVPGLGRAAVRALSAFMAMMGQLRERMLEGATPGDLLVAMLDGSGYAQALEAEESIEAAGRLENLEQLVAVAREQESDPAAAAELSLEEFLQQVALLGAAEEAMGSDQEAEAQRGLVTLMTLHNAKGSEFPHVFIIGCEEGVTPHARAIEEGALEEERRLFYVGITRAMRTLQLSGARFRAAYGAGSRTISSRFLDEIPAGLMVREGQRQSAWSSWRPEPSAGRAATGGLRIGAAAGEGTGGTGGALDAARIAAEQFPLGCDVRHASFGDGVVVGVQPGGVLIVRFAADGSERTLLAEYAKLTRG